MRKLGVGDVEKGSIREVREAGEGRDCEGLIEGK